MKKSSGVLVVLPKVSNGKRVCNICEKTIPRGRPFQEQGTPNRRGIVEYLVNVCRSCASKF